MKRCEEVIHLQEMLKDLGYYDGPINTGTFGKQTGRAVARFQRDNGLEATEVADPQTIELIEEKWTLKTSKTSVEQLDLEEMENAAEAQPALEG
ncbi:MAG: peptidoglycan-binding protein [Clostridia bacterium]|nr:peptidoglycan-binding protein [Clostridia bacterium]